MRAGMQQIGKFQLRRVLGKGASGTVYLALDTFSGKDVALKVLDQQVVASPDFERTVTAQFLNEASLAGELKHPHIAEIIEASVSRESGYIALEYVPGGDLSQYVQPGKLLTPEQAIQVAFKCCGALDYAFRQGIVHRDIKPANIMVVSGTNIKVADFGAAFLKTGPEQPATEEGGEIFGSPYYMSPEQIAGQELGMHSDMFALGVVLFELFTGKRPFTGSSLEELFAKINSEPAPAPSSVRGEIGKEVDEILLRMLGKKPEDRYGGWAEAALDLAKAGRLTLSQKSIADSDKFEALRKVPVLERLNDAEIWELVHAGSWSRVPARTAIVREGDEGKSLFFLGSGNAKVIKSGRLLNMLSAGECFGEMAYIKEGGMARQATVEAGDDTLLAEFNPDMIAKTTVNCRLQLTTALLHMVVDRLAVANQRIAAQK